MENRRPVINCNSDRFVSEFFNLGIRYFVVALVSVGTLTLGDAAALNVLLDQFGDLGIFLVFDRKNPLEIAP